MRSLLRRAGWNLVDQVLSSFTNAALSVVVARTVGDAAAFGAFGVAFLLFSFLIGIERALVGQVLGIRYSAESPEGMRDVAARALGTVAVLGAAAGVVLVVAGLVAGGTLGPPLMAVGVTMAPLLMQDTVRMIFFAQSRAALAALNDAAWAVVQFGAIAMLVWTGLARAWTLTLAWGGAAAACVLLGLVQLRALPRPRAAFAWCAAHRDLVGYLLPETLLGSGGLQASTLLVGRIVGLAGVAAFRGAQVLLGPLAIVSAAVMTFALPEMSRRPHLTEQQRWRAGIGLSAVMGGASLAYTIVLVALPDAVGTWLFRESWAAADTVLWPMGVFATAAGLSLGPALVVIALGRAREIFRLTIVETPAILVLMPVGAVLGGARGAAWGQVVVGASLVPLWFLTLRRVLRRAAADEVGTVAVPDPAPPTG